MVIVVVAAGDGAPGLAGGLAGSCGLSMMQLCWGLIILDFWSFYRPAGNL